MKRTFRQHLMMLLSMIFIVLVAVLIGSILFLSRNDGMVQHELLKLETPVANRSASFQRELHSLRINTENILPNLKIVLEKNDNLPMSERQSALLSHLMPLLEYSGASGMFFVFGELDDTLGSRDFIYIRDTRPHTNDPTYGDLMFHGGYAEAAKMHNLPLDSTWWKVLPLSEKNEAFYKMPLQALKTSGDPMDCGYFSNMFRLSKTDRSLMTFSIPSVSSTGKVLGVFGIELSKDHLQSLLPATEIPFTTGVYMFGDSQERSFQTDDVMLSGGYQDILVEHANKTVSFVHSSIRADSLEVSFNKNDVMLGISRPISLYQKGDFYFEKEDRHLVGMVRKSSFYSTINQTRQRTYLTLSLLMLACIGALIFLIYSIRTRVDAFTGELKRLHEKKDPVPCLTNLADMDEILEIVSTLSQRSTDGTLPSELLEEFIECTKALTKSERRVFELYVEGNTIKDIAELTFTSVNTIKKHTQHIYEKLNISSREELLLYVQLTQNSNTISDLK